MTTARPTVSRLQRGALILSMMSVLGLLTASAAIAATPEQAVDETRDGVYVEIGVDDVDADELQSIRRDAIQAGLDLTIIVLAEPLPSAIDFADSVNALQPGTVLVFTPDAYGVASTELSQDELDDALNGAADQLSGVDVARGAAAFLDAATPSQTNWGVIVAIGLVSVLLIAAVGRMVERKATAGRRRAALRKRWAQLEARADMLADPVLDLSTRVELDGRSAVTAAYRAAASQYGELRDLLGLPATADVVDGIEAGLDELEGRLDALEALVDGR